jgi:hypothetical protein
MQSGRSTALKLTIVAVPKAEPQFPTLWVATGKKTGKKTGEEPSRKSS